MSIKVAKILLAGLILILINACDSGPKVIESQSTKTAKAEITANSIPALNEITGSSKPATSNEVYPDLSRQLVTSNEHKVVVEEVLNTEKYTYMNVKEDGKKHWIAIPKNEVKVGETYIYTGGLLKRNFFSREYDRTFETIYLVSRIRKAGGGIGSGSALGEAISRTKAGASLDIKVGKVKPTAGAITIAELFKNKEKYKDQSVKITGKCVKVNPKIMGRNWIHLQDGSGDELDLTITTAQDIPLGAVLSLEGVIALNKDFGSGYRYDIIMEGAEMK